MMNRCSLCNTLLRPATVNEIRDTVYAPQKKENFTFSWCDSCGRLYWTGSHCWHFVQKLGLPGLSPVPKTCTGNL
jgi:hypothetical protein